MSYDVQLYLHIKIIVVNFFRHKIFCITIYRLTQCY